MAGTRRRSANTHRKATHLDMESLPFGVVLSGP
jgi:hypothetical protein